jgi:hypothetical protein
MIYIQPTKNEMIQELLNDEFAHWTHEGAEGLINYIEELSEDIGEDIAFNRVDLRCEYSEYASLQEVKDEYFSTPIHEIMEYVVARGEGFLIIRQF